MVQPMHLGHTPDVGLVTQLTCICDSGPNQGTNTQQLDLWLEHTLHPVRI